MGNDHLYQWEFDRGEESLAIETPGPLTVDESHVSVGLGVAGVGIIYGAEPVLQPHLDSGALQLVLGEWVSVGSGFHIYYSSRRQVPTELRTEGLPYASKKWERRSGIPSQSSNRISKAREHALLADISYQLKLWLPAGSSRLTQTPGHSRGKKMDPKVKVSLASIMAVSLLSPAPVAAQSLGDILGGRNRTQNIPIIGDNPLGPLTEQLFTALGARGAKDGTCSSSAAVGSALGGTIFSDSDAGRTIGAIAGGVAGQQVCKVRIKEVRREDTADVSAATQDLLESDEANSTTITTNNGRRERTYTIETSERVEREMEQSISLLEEVDAPEARSRVVSGFYTVNVRNTLNLRAGPSTSSAITGYFKGGDIVQVMSISPDGEWALLGSAGIGVGYVSTAYIEKAPQGTQLAAVALPRKHEAASTPRPSPGQPSQSAGSPAEPRIKEVNQVVVAPCKSTRINNRNSDSACNSASGGLIWS